MSSLLGKITNEISTNTKSNRDLDSIITGFEEILGIRTTQDLLECSNGLFNKLGNSLYGSKEDLYLRTAQKFLILFIYQLREHYSRSEEGGIFPLPCYDAGNVGAVSVIIRGIAITLHETFLEDNLTTIQVWMRGIDAGV